MPGTVLDVPQERPGFAQPVEDHLGDLDVAALAAAADVVDLAGRAALEHHVERRAMIGHVQPVTHVLTIAVERQRLVREGVGDEQRDDLLGVLARSEIVRGAADEDG